MPAPSQHLDPARDAVRDPARDLADSPARGLDITVRAGTGSGTTPLAAFDAALMAAGVADFNLITLSSVIPPRSIVRPATGPLPGTHGDRLFCVLSAATAQREGDEVWAGLGWVVEPDSGKGLFVEHTGTSDASVRAQIDDTLGDMCRTRDGGYGEVRSVLASTRNDGRPACALVVAAYSVAGWDVASEERNDG